eukprot:CAMPEP_0118673062 /NCGR_PEP_ID=MMETSP0800-20121206/110_1 /TAXON_ID=210618 ORGANISM="Striatella unipunctata, Strain CCMP2910" /NCGR_SAMPLE_ID=MMETSP0800 /ASSEMBLY_ACC=CAM_ASM_000638 /LENGTH=75 /DNA_ID=CAMNT_0006568077 /DNA_START=23 /DNA_END=250 /DNA_ORIENTATION=+
MFGKKKKATAPPECIECDIKNQKAVPDDSSSSQGSVCSSSYDAVAECMTANNGQVSKCVPQWDAFKKCHEEEKRS